ncbi:MAG: NUDIX hydrolase [Kofleriaceae bacterium]
MPSDDLVWRLGSRLPGHDYKIFRTAFVDARHPRTGVERRFSLIECADWVNIIAITTDQRVVLVSQYRPGNNTVCLEIPGGMIDPGESPTAAAMRELLEETGYSGGVVHELGSVAPNPAIQNNRLYTVLALGVSRTAEPTPDDGECLDITTAPLAEVQDKLASGQIDHALVVVAFGQLALAQTTLSADPTTFRSSRSS